MYRYEYTVHVMYIGFKMLMAYLVPINNDALPLFKVKLCNFW